MIHKSRAEARQIEIPNDIAIGNSRFASSLFSDMRLIGHLGEESAARTFADYLYVQGIENQLDHQKDDGWAIWILDEDKIQRATGLLSAFRDNPADPRYRTEGKAAAELRAEQEKDQEAYRKKLRSRRHLFRPLTPYGFGPLTFLMIVGSVTVFFLSKFGTDPQPIMGLFITGFDEGVFQYDPPLPEVRRGEIWRLFTPMFIHFGPLHVIFNMLWLRDLGSMIEGRQSSVHLLLLVLVIAACSNVAEFYFSRTPNFGGMSGVVYGLLGYVWIRGKLDPASGLFLHKYTVPMMISWFLACLLKFIPNVANTAHAVGLLMGMAWGYLSSLRYR
jgi:GlpG protein